MIGGLVRRVAPASSIAIVIPAYNAASTLAETVASALGQYGVAEIVIVDDGSQDNTVEIARTFAPKVRILTGPNQGASAARNWGARETSAGWLLFLDADDVLEEGTLEKRLEIVDEQDADVIICDWRDLREDEAGGVQLGPVRSVDWDKIVKNAEIATAVSVWATTAAILYRRSLYEKIGGFRDDLSVIQDARFLFEAAYHGSHIVHSPHVGARYRIVEGSLSRRDPARFWLDVLLNGEQIQALWRARAPLSDAQRKALGEIYDSAARELLIARHPAFYKCARLVRELDLRLSMRGRVALRLSRVFGLKAAASLVGGAARIKAELRNHLTKIW